MLLNVLFRSASSVPINLRQFSNLLASDGATGDYFGYSVAISDDGGSIVISAHNKGSGAGAAYAFTKQ